MAPRAQPRPLNDIERRIIQCVDEFGWFGMSVHGEPGAPSFCYSIGFTKTLRVPEVIVFGLNTDLMHGVVSDIFDAVQQGHALDEGSRFAIFQGADCITRLVHPSNIVPDHFNSALWFHGDEVQPLRAAQICWTDKNGHFPWEERCAPGVRQAQPLLFLPKE